MSNFFKKLENKNIHIVGISGAEGSSILSFLISLGLKSKIFCHDFCEEKDFKNNFFSFHDSLTLEKKEKAFNKINNSGINICFKKEYLKDIEKADLIFVSQSWFRYKFNQPLEELSKKIEFCNITRLYFNLCKAPIIAVTGTSGKSTTTRLIYEIFKKDNNRKGKVYFSGNDRENTQVLENISNIKKEDLLILEVSNRQLKIDFGKSPYLGVITNISPNHMDDHKDFDDYANTKKRLLKYQKDKDLAVLNFDSKPLQNISTKAKVYYFSRQRKLKEGSFLENNEIIISKDNKEYKICSTLDLEIPGLHNIENVLAASLAGFLYGVNTKIIREAIVGFKGLKSRIELVKEINGVRYYDDSSACNPDGPRVAITSFRESIILIVGGERKKIISNEIDKMAEYIVLGKVRVLLLMGKKANLVFEKVKEKTIKYNKLGLEMKICSSLSEAVSKAYKLAKNGEVVIMSPGFESFDMFLDYRDRAQQFKKLVNTLPYESK